MFNHLRVDDSAHALPARAGGGRPVGGLSLVGLALLLFVGTAVVALAGLPADLLVLVVLLGVVGCVTLGWWLRARAWVLRCTDEGYRVRLVRGAGVTEARWSAVEDAVTTVRHDVACVELRLRDGRTTVIPVGVLAVDREVVRARAPGSAAAGPRAATALIPAPGDGATWIGGRSWPTCSLLRGGVA